MSLNEILTLGPLREQSVAGRKLEVFRISWKESSIAYREALKIARSAYFSNLLGQNKHNPVSI